MYGIPGLNDPDWLYGLMPAKDPGNGDDPWDEYDEDQAA